MTFYNNIFRKSWEVTKKNKILWLFGLFGMFWGGKGIDLEIFFTNADLLKSSFSPFRPEFWQIQKWTEVGNRLFPNNISLVAIIIFVVVVLLFVMALIMFSQIGLIDAFGNDKKQKGKNNETYSITNAIDVGREVFPSVLTVNLIGKGISYGLVALASSPLFLAQFEMSRLVYTAFLFIVLTPLAVLVSVLTKYAVNDIVLHRHGVTESVWVAWKTFVNNVGVSIELAVYMFVWYAAVNIAAITFILLLTLPLYFFGLVLYLKTGAVIGIGLFEVFVYLGSAIAITFSSIVFSAWQRAHNLSI